MALTDRTLLALATQALIADPAASMGDIATAAGISRTTLHARYPSREALLVAMADEAMDRVSAAYREARLDEGPVPVALERVVALLVPQGAHAQFLLRERSLDSEEAITRRYAELDAPLLALVERGQADGSLRGDLPAWWLVATVVTQVFAAWEAIDAGRLARQDAARFVLAVLLDGARSRDAVDAV